jgi:hypothetical protein
MLAEKPGPVGLSGRLRPLAGLVGLCGVHVQCSSASLIYIILTSKVIIVMFSASVTCGSMTLEAVRGNMSYHYT